MISVLIPIFNTDVRELVDSLSAQLLKSNLPFEICLLDDGSDTEIQTKNRALNRYTFCSYKENNKNKGRLQTREELAKTAQYPWLLFIDADCVLNNHQYIQNYTTEIEKGYSVIIGGTAYQKEKPSNCQLYLHWLYGSKRIATYTSRYIKDEQIYQGFLFNNVLIKKDLFLSLSFPNEWQSYGHEDTWVGMQFERERVKLLKINNPVLHPQLDEASIFLKKNTIALKNIKHLLSFTNEKQVSAHVKIYKYHKILLRYRTEVLFNFFIHLLKNKMEKNLHSCKPSLILFDLYRLYHLNKLMRGEEHFYKN